MTVKRPNLKASKTDILKAFDALNAELKALQSTPAPVAAKAAPEPEPEEVEPVEVGSEVQPTIGAVTQSLHTLKGSFGAAVSNLSADQSAEATRLAALRAEAEGTLKQLAELHGIKEVGDATLPAVVREHADKSEAYRKELAEKTEATERDLGERRKAWFKEQEEHARLVKERNDNLAKAQKRDQEEYDYELAQRRKHDAEQDELETKRQQATLEEQATTKARTWAEKELVVAEREKQFAETFAKHDELPARRDAALKRAKGEGEGIASYQAKVKADLLAKEIDGERRVAELKIKGLESTIAEQAARLGALQQQLAAVLKQGQDLAVKAIEGASNASTFIAVKEIAMEQAKNAPKGK